MIGVNWTDEAIAILRDCCDKGMSFAMASGELSGKGYKYSRNACIGKAKRIGILTGRPAPTITRARSPRTTSNGTTRIEAHMNGAIAFKITRALRAKKLRDGVPDVPLAPGEILLGFRHKHITELDAGECKWPEGGDGSPITFCGLAQHEGFPYCTAHARLAYTAPTDRPGHVKAANTRTGQFA
jgi:GcrA cell cycle regulator